MAGTSPSNAGVVGSIPGWGARILHASKPNVKQKHYSNKFKKDFKNDPTLKKILKNSYHSHVLFPFKIQ